MIEASVRLMLDVQHSGMPVTVRTKQGDTSRKLLITLTDGGNQYKLGADCQAVLAGKKPDGTVLFNNCEIDNNVIRYEFTEQTCAVSGNVISEIRIYGGGKLLTSASFVIEVLSTTVSEDDVISTDEMNALDALYLDTKALKDEIQRKLDNGEFIGPPGPSTAEALDAANRARESANTATQAAAASAGAAASAEQAAVRAEAGAAKVEYIEKTAEEANAKVDTLREVVSKFHSNIQETSRGEIITVSDASDLPLAGLKVFGRTEQNGIPKPAAPVALKSVGDVKVTVCGTNLLDMTNGRSNTATGVTYTKNADGSYNRAGTAENQYGNIWFLGGYNRIPGEDNVIITLLPGKVYFIRDCALYTADSNGAIAFYDNFSSSTGAHVNKAVTVNANIFPDGVKITGVRCPQLVVGNSYNDTIYPSIYLGGSNIGWEPYDGNTIHISTDYGLPGIPVTSGGNYTDPVTGKHWICDEVDFEKGVYVQRVGKKTLTGSEDWSYSSGGAGRFITYSITDADSPSVSSIRAPILCNSYTGESADNVYGGSGKYFVALYNKETWFNATGFADVIEFTAHLSENPVTLIYKLAEEKHIPLSEDQKAAFADLHSNYPNTTVFNDQNAGMEVKYVADTKLYVDKKFNELAAALVNRT